MHPDAPSTVPDWRRSYARRLLWSDVFVVAWAVFGAQFLWFGIDTRAVTVPEELATTTFNYTLVSVGLAVVWLLALGGAGTRESRVVGAGSDEYKRVARASLQVFGLFAILAFAFQVQLSRGYLLVALPAGLFVLILERWLWRQWLGSVRRTGQYSFRSVIVGASPAAAEIASVLSNQTSAGYHVVAACLSDSNGRLSLPAPVPVAPLTDLRKVMQRERADTVIMVGGHGLSPRQVSEISWALIPGREHLVMVPNLVDIAGPRIHTRPVAGLPLIHVETPRYQGASRFTKRAFDVLASIAAIVLLSPVLLAASIAVKATSPGPVLFRQQRIGKDEHPFEIYKFRSMRVGADAELHELLKAQGTHDKPLFKVTNDPRLTRIGPFLRRTSIDELPQLFNVLGGSMSMVGPRPQVQAEVSLYDEKATRRLTVKPGITGLWQVSGRSALTWDDAIHLDLYYVENWSLIGDVQILLKTANAVFARHGAY